MSIGAAVPFIAWSDLAYALAPNGRVLDYALADDSIAWEPLGVMKHSAVAGLWRQGRSHYNAPPDEDDSIDLQRWFNAFPTSALESEVSRKAATEFASNHSAMGVPIGPEPSPTLIANGFTDDIFPVNEAVRWVNHVRRQHPDAVIAQLYGDFGHRRANQNSEPLLKPRALAWFRKHLQDKEVEVLDGVEAFVQQCGGGFGELHTAPSWQELSAGEIRQRFSAPVTIASSAENPSVSRQIDPPSGRSEDVQSDACRTVDAAPAEGTGIFELDAFDASVTLMGSPMVIAKLSVESQHNAVLVARLWAQDDSGRRTLVTHGIYRPDVGANDSPASEAVFQLNSNAWTFEAGSRPVLQILGRSTPYVRAPEHPFTVNIQSLEVRLPTVEAPKASGSEQVKSGAPRPLPAGMRWAPGYGR
ncbi:MAG: prolyl oligopeptidase family serine peptidase [Gammaproteobacteria bacterium]|jgi:hypothetical protein|nr:prolyl oligopeptidase family serine peptidase [Gammaproteobacteria bacterium]